MPRKRKSGKKATRMKATKTNLNELRRPGESRKQAARRIAGEMAAGRRTGYRVTGPAGKSRTRSRRLGALKLAAVARG
jgi:hypothetical protein